VRTNSRPARFTGRLPPLRSICPAPWSLAPYGEWSGRAGWCASRDCFIGLAAFLADLWSAPPAAASQPDLAATQGGMAANPFGISSAAMVTDAAGMITARMLGRCCSGRWASLPAGGGLVQASGPRGGGSSQPTRLPAGARLQPAACIEICRSVQVGLQASKVRIC
jgi:hypothetical protein